MVGENFQNGLNSDSPSGRASQFFQKTKAMLQNATTKTSLIASGIGASVGAFFKNQKQKTQSKIAAGVEQKHTLLLVLALLFWIYDTIFNSYGSYIANRQIYLAVLFLVYAIPSIVITAFKGEKKMAIATFIITGIYTSFAITPGFQVQWYHLLKSVLGYTNFGAFVAMMLSMRSLVPIMLLYVLHKRDTKTSNAIVQIYIIGWLIIGFFAAVTSTVFGQFLGATAKPDFTISDLTTGPKEAFKTWIANINKHVNNAYNDSMNWATGGLYSGEQEQYQEKDLGVRFAKLSPGAPKYYNDEPITAWGQIHAKTINKEIKLFINCTIQKGKNITQGVVTPESPITIDREDVIDFECEFNKNFEPGSYTIKAWALYNFETDSRLKAYFIDKDYQKSLIRQNIDVFSHFKINDRNPIGVYTDGPIQLGMETTQPLIGIYKNKDNPGTRTIGVSVDKKWDGQIKKINNLKIITPSSINLNTDKCTPKFEKTTGRSGSNTYQILKPITAFLDQGRSFTCAFDFPNPSELLGDTPLRVEYFRSQVDYTYEINSQIGIQVVPSPFADDTNSDASDNNDPSDSTTTDQPDSSTTDQPDSTTNDQPDNTAADNSNPATVS